MSDFIFTIESDEEDGIAPQNRDTGTTDWPKSDQKQRKKLNKKLVHQHTLELNPELMLDGLGFDANSNFELTSRRSQLLNQFDDPLERFKKKNSAPRVSLDEIIARHQKPDDLVALTDHESEDWDDDSTDNHGTSNGENDDDAQDKKNQGESSSEEEDDDENLDEIDEESDGDQEDASSGDDGSMAEDDEDNLPEEENNETKTEDENNNTSTQEYFDQSIVPFGPATKEELSKDTHEQPFSSLPGSASLSRSVLLGLSSMAITTPTPIQRQAIPLGLLGKDLVCSSVTGSGKTLGYMVPIVERLMWRDKRGGGRTRVMVLTPTRELAVQVFQVGKSLARFTDLTFSLCVGGMDLRAQEAELRERPEIVIGTPGRVIDHVRNTRGFSLETLEILVIDEADRILEEGFQDELEEIIRNCPRSRQTMLFSATVNESVADLAKLSLDKPVRIKIDPPKSTALGLTQEFLKVKDNSSGKKSTSLFDVTRQAILVALCKTSAFSKGKTIIFFRSKAGAHRMKIIFSLFSLRAEELHGNLTQQQRLSSLQKFKEGQTSYLLATDLASRGLDIKGVERVINYEPPTQYDVYLHRIGRTARAGTKGIALTLVGESDRKLIKEAKKNCSTSSQGGIKQRKIDSNLVKKIQNEIEKLSDTISEIIKEEKEDKQMKKSEMELKKCSNLIEFDDEIKSRPARTWFQSESDKKLSKQIGTSAHTAKFTTATNKSKSLLGKSKEESKNSIKKRDRFDGLSRKQKRRKMGQEEDAKEKVMPAIQSSIRAAKKAQRPIKISASQADQDKKNHDLLSMNKKKLNKLKTLGKKKKNSKNKSSSSLDMIKKNHPHQKKSSASSSKTPVKKSNMKNKK